MLLEETIYKANEDVNQKLECLGATREELLDVVGAVELAKNNTIITDPVTAGGQFAYIYGTRAIRNLFIPKGYVQRTNNGIEEVYNSSTGVRIVFQNVDSAADPLRAPKAISKKGPASERMVALATPYLFAEMEEDRISRINDSVWYFCVSINGDDVRAELSRPISIENGQFSLFLERIFIVNIGEWDGFDPSKFDEEDGNDLVPEINVTRK